MTRHSQNSPSKEAKVTKDAGSGKGPKKIRYSRAAMKRYQRQQLLLQGEDKSYPGSLIYFV